MSKKELGITVVVLLIGITILVLTPFQTSAIRHQANSIGISLTPRTFPVFTAILLIALSLLYLFKLYNDVRSRKKKGITELWIAEAEEDKVNLFPVILITAIMIAYVYLMIFIGFIFSSIILCTFFAIYFKSKWWHVIISGLVIPVGAFYLFQLLYVYLPTGTLW